jgi:hypothetical protein
MVSRRTTKPSRRRTTPFASPTSHSSGIRRPRGPERRPNDDRNDHGSPLLVVDCGSTSVGWTKYLSERTDLDAIYAVESGEMDAQVSSLPNVRHLRMMSADAILRPRDVLSSTRGGGRGGARTARGSRSWSATSCACTSQRDRSTPSCAFASRGCSDRMPRLS